MLGSGWRRSRWSRIAVESQTSSPSGVVTTGMPPFHPAARAARFTPMLGRRRQGSPL
jgi:hypothetical protein